MTVVAGSNRSVFGMIKELAESHAKVTLYLTNGVKLSGDVKIVDDMGIWLVRDGRGQAVLWHGISTVVPDSK